MDIKRGNTVLASVYLKDNSYVNEEVMGEHTLTLNFVSRHVVDLQINDYVDFEGGVYKIRHNEKVSKRETSLGWEYGVVFYSSEYDLRDVEFFLHGKPERKKNFDSYTGTARQVLELIVKNMNRTGSGWTSGSCIESRAETFSFKDKKCGTVLDEVVKAFGTERWISGKTISIGKREYASNGLVLGQGEGMGFTELEVSAVDDAPPVTVLYPYGSDKNLSTDYGSDYLLLPAKVSSIEKNVNKYGYFELSKSFDHIFPKGEFTVTEKIDNFTLKASGIDFDLTTCLLDGQEVIVTFQDGGLAGYDLAVVDKSWVNATKQFKLKQNDQENALKVPGDINFSVGDKFILTNLKMPQSYIDNASLQLQTEASKYLDEHCEKRVQLRGKCDDILFRQRNIFISCGQMVGIVSDELKIEREIRVTRVKRYIENDNEPTYRYELTLSDFLQSNGFKDVVDDVNKMPDEIEDKVKPVREWTKRSWRDVKETQDMVFDPDGSFQTEFTSSLMAEFAHLIVGLKSQQMDLVGIKFIPNADNDPNYFKSTAGKLVHFTVRDTIAEWAIPASASRMNNALAYYVYAKCSKTTTAGSILVTERKIKLEEESGYYHFWVGVLNTPEENVRSWNPNYGFTEIAGQTITTGVIKDKLARLVIDLVNAKITAMNGASIEGKIKFTSGSSGLDNVAEWPSAKEAIKDAQSTADNAIKEIGDTNKALSGFEVTVNGAFKDGIIEAAEAKAIEKYINTLNTEKAEADAVYNKLYANAYLSGNPKNNLLNAKITYNGAHTNLINSVNAAIADGRTTVAEKYDVDRNFASYRSALSSFYTAIETANMSIQNVIKEAYEAKDDIAKKLGYTSYADLNAKALAGETIINGGKISTTLIEAEAVVAKGITAGIIEALTIETNKLTVLSGARIGNFIIEDGWLKTSSPSGSSAGYIDMTTGNTRIAFGEDLIPSSAGGSYTLTGLIENKANNKGGGLGMEYENVALRLSAKNADANWGLDCHGGIRRIGRSVEINEPLMIAGGADTIESKFRYYGHFMFQPPAGNNMIVRLPSSYMINNAFGTLPNGTPASLGMLTLTVTVQVGFNGEVTLVGVQGGQIFNTDGGKFDNSPISGYNYGTILLKQCDIVKLYHFNGGWFFHYFSRDIL